MAKLLKLRRGTTSQHSSFTGAEGEVTVDTDKETLVVHDGSTAGGHPVAAEDLANVSSSTIAGRLSNDSIATSKIAAGTLPSDVKINSANINDGQIVNADIFASAAIANSKLADSGVTAGAYGSSSAIPIVTVNAKGVVTAASTTAIDSTTIANGSSSVSVANNGAITSNANHDFGAGIDVTGIITSTGNVNTTGNITITNEQPKVSFIDSGNNPDYQLINVDGVLTFYDSTNSADRLRVNSDGHVDVTGNLDVGSGIDVTGSVIASGSGNSFGDTTITSAAPTLNFDDSNSNPDFRIINNSGSFEFQDKTNSYAARIKINSDGHVDIPGNLDAEGGVDVTGNITVSGTVDGVDIAALNTTVGNLGISGGAIASSTTATTQSASDNSTKVATTAYVTTGIANAQAFPSGTVMLFAQTSAPTGWTKSTSHNNKALRVVSGTASSGGNQTFNTIFASRNLTASAGNTTATGNISVANGTGGGSVSIANATTGGTVNSHTLTTSEMPSHSHSVQGAFGSNTNYGTIYVTTRRQPVWQAVNTGNTGGGGGHSHGFTGGSHNHNANFTGNAHNHNASFSGSAHNHSISVNNLDMQVQYVDVILATKD